MYTGHDNSSRLGVIKQIFGKNEVIIRTKFLGEMQEKEVHVKKLSLTFRESEYSGCFPKQLLDQESEAIGNVIKEKISLGEASQLKNRKIWDNVPNRLAPPPIGYLRLF